MDKAIVFGVFEFVGFHICKSLLDKGIEVKGISFEQKDAGSFLDEKRLEVGRNSNFIELQFTDWVQHTCPEDTIILSLYDLYMVNKTEIITDEAFTQQLLETMTKSLSKLILIAPSHLLTSEKEQDPFIEIVNFISKCKETADDNQIIYLPTIYGPWQPETFIFQHTILGNFRSTQPFTELREDIRDALYIEDSVKSMIDLFETGEKGKYLFENKKKDQWTQCANFLKINHSIVASRSVKEIKDQVNKILIEPTMDISIGLTKQIELSTRLYPS